VGQGPGGPQVFVVDEEGLARARTIELGPLVEGGRVVLAGLEGGERLVVNGQVALRDGTLVAAEPAEGALAEALTTAAGGSGEDG
jgi:membrane fusion protein, multidrug efflux system